MKFKLEDFHLDDYIIINENGIQDTDSENIRNIPVRVTKITPSDVFPLQVESDGVTDYSKAFSIDEVTQIITRKDNPEYWL